MLRIVIIEDEPATARELEYHLLQLPTSITIVANLGSVQQAVSWFSVNTNSYDLVFMDIRLSDGLSFEIFGLTSIKTPVVFVTAYDDYALMAFKTNGIDYILKPFDPSQLQQAIQKFQMLTSFSNQAQNQLLEIATQLKSAYTGYKQSFLVHYRDKLIPIAVKDIAYFFTVNEVSYAITFEKRKLIIEFTLEQLQNQLNPYDFIRANRQFIVQRKAIKEIDFYFNGRLLLKTEPAAEEIIIISKAKVPDFKTWMNA